MPGSHRRKTIVRRWVGERLDIAVCTPLNALSAWVARALDLSRVSRIAYFAPRVDISCVVRVEVVRIMIVVHVRER